jgi:RNA-directed DNA polymerase
VTWDQYAENLEANLADLHARVHAGTYRALPSRRKYIPKADGRQRPLGIAAIEDKIVQAAVVAILTLLSGKQDEKSTSIRMRECRRMRDERRA